MVATLSPIDAAMASVPEANPHRARNRRANVLKIAGVIDEALRANDDGDLDEVRAAQRVERLTDAEWLQAWQIAGLTKEPSAETRKVVVAFYAERAKAALADEAEAARDREAELLKRDLLNEDGRDDDGYSSMVEEASP